MRRSVMLLLIASIALLAPATPVRAQQITFNKDIAPIIWQNCTSCHRSGQIGPFSLFTFEDVRPRAREIVRAVKSHTMPPWKPEPGHGEFEGVRRLSDAQIALLERWVDQGSRQGDPNDLLPSPAWSAGWQLGEPDLIVSMSALRSESGRRRRVPHVRRADPADDTPVRARDGISSRQLRVGASRQYQG